MASQLKEEHRMSKTSARLDLRIDPAIKELAARASALTGSHSLSEFVIQAIREKSVRVIEEAEVYRLNSQSFDAFVAACEAAPAPNEALLSAKRRRGKRMENGDLEVSPLWQDSWHYLIFNQLGGSGVDSASLFRRT